jgi:hypothetical protein
MSKYIMTPRFRASYPKLFKAELNEMSGKLEYSVVALFKKGEDLSKLKKAAEDLLVEKLGADRAKWPKKLKSPFRDQSEREKDGVLPAGHEEGAVFITLKSESKPGVINGNLEPIIDASEIYAGCLCLATVRPYYYDKNGNKGVSLGLQNVQKVADGEPLGGARVAAATEFAPVAEDASGEDMWS